MIRGPEPIDVDDHTRLLGRYDLPEQDTVKESFENIIYLSLEEYAENRLDEDIISRGMVDTWAVVYPAIYNDLAPPPIE